MLPGADGSVAQYGVTFTGDLRDYDVELLAGLKGGSPPDVLDEPEATSNGMFFAFFAFDVSIQPADGDGVTVSVGPTRESSAQSVALIVPPGYDPNEAET